MTHPVIAGIRILDPDSASASVNLAPKSALERLPLESLFLRFLGAKS